MSSCPLRLSPRRHVPDHSPTGDVASGLRCIAVRDMRACAMPHCRVDQPVYVRLSKRHGGLINQGCVHRLFLLAADMLKHATPVDETALHIQRTNAIPTIDADHRLPMQMQCRLPVILLRAQCTSLADPCVLNRPWRDKQHHCKYRQHFGQWHTCHQVAP